MVVFAFERGVHFEAFVVEIESVDDSLVFQGGGGVDASFGVIVFVCVAGPAELDGFARPERQTEAVYEDGGVDGLDEASLQRFAAFEASGLHGVVGRGELEERCYFGGRRDDLVVGVFFHIEGVVVFVEFAIEVATDGYGAVAEELSDALGPSAEGDVEAAFAAGDGGVFDEVVVVVEGEEFPVGKSQTTSGTMTGILVEIHLI